MSLRIREYHPDDLAAIHVINEAAYPAVGTETIEALGHIADESVIALVADEPSTGTIAGFCLVLAPGADYDSMNYLWFVERYDDFVYLDRVAISPDFQRRGLGRDLYAEVEQLRCRTAAGRDAVHARGQPAAAQRPVAGVPRRSRLRRGRPAGDRLRHPRQPDGQAAVSGAACRVANQSP